MRAQKPAPTKAANPRQVRAAKPAPPQAQRAARTATPKVRKARTPAAKPTKVKATKPDHTKNPSTVAAKRFAERRAVNQTRQSLYRAGYTSVRQMQHNKSGHGGDLLAVKKDSLGRVRSTALIEVKGSNVRNPGPSSFRKQTSMPKVRQYAKRAEAANVRGADQLNKALQKGRLERYGATYGPGNVGRGASMYRVSARNRPVHVSGPRPRGRHRR